MACVKLGQLLDLRKYAESTLVFRFLQAPEAFIVLEPRRRALVEAGVDVEEDKDDECSDNFTVEVSKEEVLMVSHAILE